MTYAEWRNQAIGKHIDVDGAFGAQCVDVYLDYIQKVIGVLNWSAVSGLGDAKDLYAKANPQYFDKVADVHQARQGDVIIYGATPTNGSGHIAIVDSADTNGVTVVEQDGFNPSGSAYTKYRKFNGNELGLLRRKGQDVTIQNEPNWKARCSKTMKMIRGREISDTEFTKYAVGQDFQKWVEAVEDNKEADNYYALGQWAKANKDSVLKQLADYKAQQASASEANLLGQALIKLLATFGYKKG